MAAAPDGTTLVAWTDDSGLQIWGRRYDGNGTALGSAFQISNDPILAYSPTVAADGLGHFIVAWVSNGAEIVVQRLDTAGAAVGPALPVSFDDPDLGDTVSRRRLPRTGREISPSPGLGSSRRTATTGMTSADGGTRAPSSRTAPSSRSSVRPTARICRARRRSPPHRPGTSSWCGRTAHSRVSVMGRSLPSAWTRRGCRSAASSRWWRTRRPTSGCRPLPPRRTDSSSRGLWHRLQLRHGGLRASVRHPYHHADLQLRHDRVRRADQTSSRRPPRRAAAIREKSPRLAEDLKRRSERASTTRWPTRIFGAGNSADFDLDPHSRNAGTGKRHR